MKSINDKIEELVLARQEIEEQMEAEIARVREKFAAKRQSLELDINALFRAAELMGEAVNPAFKTVPALTLADMRPQRGAPPKGELSIGDAIEKAIREAGKPLKVSEIADAIERMGVVTSPNSLRSTLSGDHRNRFERVEYGVYTLRQDAVKSATLSDIYESVKERESSAA
jgi:hypothetical protein